VHKAVNGARFHEYRIVARNSAATSVNVIHADDGARAMGFRAALVPGNALYCYLESAARGGLGPDWAERGAAELPPPVAGFPRAALPESPPPFSEAWALDSVQLGSLDPVITREDVAAYLDGLGERPDAFGPDVPSAFLARLYARIMAANVVRRDPSIHTSSRISHFRRVELGQPLSVRGHLDRLFGRRGNRYYVLDMAYLDEGGEVVMTQRHTAIYRLRPREPVPASG
jgi:hypothetical protein